ncbi:MAG: argininosuccinate synthase [Vampirovibrionales bacterium]|nr:argininosuccinate synthase [Vampirovibrionales bacterium]
MAADQGALSSMSNLNSPKLNTIVLAYSGGLDTTVIIPWLKENYGSKVIAVCVDVGVDAGTAEEISVLEKRAKACGADEVIIEQVQEEFVSDFIYPCLKAGAVYEGQYLLGTAMARPLIASVLVKYAKQYDADAICHGATGKGNDQVRFELSIKALAPDLAIIAPWRLWHIQSREDAIAYLEERNLPIPSKRDESYSRDNNLWHLSHEGLELEDPANAPEYERLLQRSRSPFTASDTPAIIELSFEKGLPVSLDGKKLSPVALLQKLNEIGGANGIGILDMVENRVVGLKARGVYETPGGSILYKAHDMLEQLCLDRKTLSIKHKLAIDYAHLVYTGEWFTPARQALDAFIDVTQQTVTGTVSLMLYKGNMIPQGMKSPYSLYDAELASFTTGALYQHQDAQGFITLTGLPMQVRARMMAKQAAADEASG